MQTSHRCCFSIWLLVLWYIVPGCASENTFRVADLPPQLVAPVIENPQTVDLSRLSINQKGTQFIDAGDVLDVTISAGLSSADTTTIPTRVTDQGNIFLPVIGNVPVAGLEPEAAEAAIATTCIQKGLYRTPQITVSTKRQRVNRVTVIGAVAKQGVYEIPRGSSDLVAALVAAGGLAEDAGTEVEIRHPVQETGIRKIPAPIAADPLAPDVSPAGHSTTFPNGGGTNSVPQPRVTRISLVRASENAIGGYYLKDGAIVRVEKRDPMPVHVIGLVNGPGRYDYPIAEEMRLLDAIALAGGMSSPVADKIFVIRQLKDQAEPAVIVASVRKAKRDGQHNLRLTPGDIVSVENTPATVIFGAFQFINVGLGGSIPLF